MDVRLSAEQMALRDSVVQAVGRLGPRTVAALGDAERAAKLDAAVAASGWRELRAAGDGGGPWASAVEVAIVSEELGRGLADAAFVGPTLSSELRRMAGAPAVDGETVALGSNLLRLAASDDGVLEAGAVGIDALGATSALVLVSDGHGLTLGAVEAGEVQTDADLTRPVWRWAPSPGQVGIPGQTRPLSSDDLDRWTALGLAVTSADLVGVMRGALDLACDYARAAPVRGRHRLLPGGAAPAGRRSGGDGGVAQHRAPRGVGRRRARRTGRAGGRLCGEGLLRPRRSNGLRDGDSGARRHREHVGVPRARLPAASAPLHRVARRSRAEPRARAERRGARG